MSDPSCPMPRDSRSPFWGFTDKQALPGPSLPAPTPTRVRAGAGPTGGWGAMGPPVRWASGQHGGGGGGDEKVAACPRPGRPGLASPAAVRASGTGGPVGDNSSRRHRRRQGGGERRGRGSGRGTRGTGTAGGRGRGGRANPRPAARPRPARPPAPRDPGGPPPTRQARPGRWSPGGRGPTSPAGRTSHGNNRAIGCCCRELNQPALRAAVARRQRSGQRSRAQTKGGSGAGLPPPRLPFKRAPPGSAPSRNPAVNSRAPPHWPEPPPLPC